MLTGKDIEYIIANEGADVNRLLLKDKGKADGINLPLCASCIQAREKMKVKAPLWYANPALAYPFSLSVEQGSSQATALFKQRIIRGLFQQHPLPDDLPGGKAVPLDIRTADLTGGMGIDSYFISRIAARHYYFERNAELCAAAAWNFRQLGAGNIVTADADVTRNGNAALKELSGKGISLLFIDPARRDSANGKTILLQDYEPNILEMLDDLFSVSEYVLVKVSPMADIKLNLKLLPQTINVYVVAVNNECRELLFLLRRPEAPRSCGKGAAEQPYNPSGCGNWKEPRIICANLAGDKETFRFSFCLSEEETAAAKYAMRLGEYLYEPGKALLKGGAYKLACNRYGLEKLAPSTHLYTGGLHLEDFPGKCFRICESLPFSKKNMKAIASRYPKADLSARNFPMDTNALKKMSGIRDGGDRHIFVFSLSNGERTIAVCAPLS